MRISQYIRDHQMNDSAYMKKSLLLIGGLLSAVMGFSQHNLVQYVDTRIGANSVRASNCVIGPTLPFGCINPSPQSAPCRNTSGYDPKMPVRGFGQLHVSGTGGAGKYGHFLVSPQTGLAVGVDDHYSPMNPEYTQAYYFKALLNRYQVITEISPTKHCALYRFTFPATDSASIVWDATQSVTIDILKREAEIVDNTIAIDAENRKIKAMIRFKGGWGGKEPYYLYMVAAYDKQAVSSGLWRDKEILLGSGTISREKIANQRIGSYCLFNTKKDQQVLMKVAISYSSFDNAERFLQDEISGWDFEKIKTAAMNVWERQLNKIQVEAKTDEQKKIFYTAMYHSMVMPRDKTGDNPNWKSNQPYWDDHYANWDTWRTLYPLHTLINKDMVRGTVLSYLDRFKHNGQVKDAFIAGIDMVNEQGGNDIDNIIADAYLKGIKGIDWEEAYKLLKHHADNDRICYSSTGTIDKKKFSSEYLQQGWVSRSWSNASSATLEFAYNDFCLSEVAKGLGKKDDENKYRLRSNNWEHLWDSSRTDKNYKGFIGIKDSAGNFTDFNTAQVYGSWKFPFYEGSSWTYSYFVPHNYTRLIQLMGGEAAFAERLDFALKHNLIDYGNEPSFVALRAFCHAHRPDLASYWIRFATNKNYDLSGVTGNDDSGAMSSWYIFSVLGFFPNAGQDIYYLNAPLFEQSMIDLGNGKKLTIIAKKASEKNVYIKSCKINGKQWESPIFKNSMIANGGTIEMELSESPTDWGRK